MNLTQRANRYRALLDRIALEIEDFNLDTNPQCVSPGDLLAELLWIASRIRKLQTSVDADPPAVEST